MPITNESFENPRKLRVIQRLNIAIVVTSALDYLHHHFQTPIVHCYLKPSNVFLDDKMIGHVSNFGLAKFLHAIIQDSSTIQSSSIGVRGKIDYTPPSKYILHFISLILFSARLKAPTVALHLPSSSFIWQWQKLVISSARNVA